MILKEQIIGSIDNPASISERVNVPTTVLILGTAAIGAYIGWSIGGPIGAAVGALVGAFVGALAAGKLRSLDLRLMPSGEVKVRFGIA